MATRQLTPGKRQALQQQIARQRSFLKKPGENLNARRKINVAQSRLRAKVKGNVPGGRAIPPINENPQPPNAANPWANAPNFDQQPPGPTVGAPAPTDPALAPTSITPADYFKSSYTAAAGAPDPRDATYWENLNKLRFSAENEYNQNLKAQADAGINNSAALDSMLSDRNRRERSLAESMLTRGLAYSGHHDTSQAEDQTDYLRQRGDFERQALQEQQARQAAQQAILQGFSIDEAALLAEAVGRYAEGQGEEAEEGNPDLAGLDFGEGTAAAQRKKQAAARREQERKRNQAKKPKKPPKPKIKQGIGPAKKKKK